MRCQTRCRSALVTSTMSSFFCLTPRVHGPRGQQCRAQCQRHPPVFCACPWQFTAARPFSAARFRNHVTHPPPQSHSDHHRLASRPTRSSGSHRSAALHDERAYQRSSHRADAAEGSLRRTMITGRNRISSLPCPPSGNPRFMRPQHHRPAAAVTRAQRIARISAASHRHGREQAPPAGLLADRVGCSAAHRGCGSERLNTHRTHHHDPPAPNSSPSRSRSPETETGGKFEIGIHRNHRASPRRHVHSCPSLGMNGCGRCSLVSSKP